MLTKGSSLSIFLKKVFSLCSFDTWEEVEYQSRRQAGSKVFHQHLVGDCKEQYNITHKMQCRGWGTLPNSNFHIFVKVEQDFLSQIGSPDLGTGFFCLLWGGGLFLFFLFLALLLLLCPNLHIWKCTVVVNQDYISEVSLFSQSFIGLHCVVLYNHSLRS